MRKQAMMRLEVLLLAGAALFTGDPFAATPAEHYRSSCMACHGGDGAGVMPGVPDLSEPGGPLGKADEVLFQAIWVGSLDPASGVTMPPRGGNPELSETDVRELIGYMRRAFLD